MDCRIVRDRQTGQSKSIAFIDVKDEDTAEILISKVDGKEIRGNKVKLYKSKPPELLSEGNTIFVNGVSEQISEVQMKENFEQFGQIEEIRMKKGFCYIQYASKQEAETAVKAMNGKEISGCALSVEVSKSRNEM